MIAEQNLPRDFKGVFIPKEIYLNNELSSTEKILYAEIDSLFNEEKGGCFASNEYLEKFLGVKKRMVQYGISKLKKLGFINEFSFNGRERILTTMHVRDAKNCTSTVQESAGLLHIIDNKKDDTKIPVTWKINFPTYQREEQEAYNQLIKDETWLKAQEKYKKYPGINVRKSLEKAHVTFWSTEEGWKHKKKSSGQVINWKSTYAKALGMQFNHVYDPKEGDYSQDTDETDTETPRTPWEAFRATMDTIAAQHVQIYLGRIWENLYHNKDWIKRGWPEPVPANNEIYKKSWEIMEANLDYKEVAFELVENLFGNRDDEY